MQVIKDYFKFSCQEKIEFEGKWITSRGNSCWNKMNYS